MGRLIAFLFCLVLVALGSGWVRAGMALGALAFALVCAWGLALVLGLFKDAP